MSEPLKKERSPSSPRIPLSEAIEISKKLHAKAGKSAIHPENAVQALGYSGLNGAALGLLATLKQYGLLDSQRGSSVSVSSLAIKLIHPMSHQQEAESRKTAALSPKVFSELFTSGYAACAVDVLTNHLIQSGFTPDGARKAASVFKENEEFAKLGSPSIEEEVISKPEPASSTPVERTPSIAFSTSAVIAHPTNVTKEFTFPLDEENEVEIKFLGTRFEPKLLDELEAVITFLKTRFQRKSLAQMYDETKPAPLGAEMPSE